MGVIGYTEMPMDRKRWRKLALESQSSRWAIAVSYTHLDVYKRQGLVTEIFVLAHGHFVFDVAMLILSASSLDFLY